MGDHKEQGINIDPAFVRALAELLDDTGLSEIEVEDGERKIRVARTLSAAPVAYAPARRLPRPPLPHPPPLRPPQRPPPTISPTPSNRRWLAPSTSRPNPAPPISRALARQ